MTGFFTGVRASLRAIGPGARAAAIALAAVGSCTAAQAECRTEPIRLTTSSEAITTHWRVTKGEVCGVTIGGGYSGNVDEFAIVRKPAHGAAIVINRIADHSFGYRPVAGYVGPDHFQVSMRANVARDHVSYALTVDVEIEVVGKR